MNVVRILIIVSLLEAGAGAQSAIEIPFRWTPGQIEISVSINGKQPIWCLLDTGSEVMILDTEVSQALGLNPTAQRFNREFVEKLNISIGGISMRNMSAMLMPLNNFRRQKRDIRGVIGCDFFEQSAVTIDFKKQKMYVTPSPSFRPDAKATAIPIMFVDRLPVMESKLTIGSRTVKARLMIDTGASQAVILRHPFTESNGFFKLSTNATTEETLAAGPRGFVELPAKTIQFAHWKLSNPLVSAYGSRDGAGGYTETDGLIGNDVLRRFLVTFDYQRKKMFLKENEDLHLPFTLR